MWLFSFILTLVILPAGIIAVGILTKTRSHYLTLIYGAVFGAAIYCIALLVVWDIQVDIETAGTMSTKSRQFGWIYGAVVTPVFTALFALVVKVGAKVFVR